MAMIDPPSPLANKKPLNPNSGGIETEILFPSQMTFQAEHF